MKRTQKNKRKNRLLIILCILILVSLAFFLKSFISNLFGNDNKRYALNLYDENFQYTRGLEAFYNKKGELKSIDAYIIFDSSSFQISGRNDDTSSKYPESEISVIANDDGSVKVSNYVTSNSIEAGALEDNAFYMLKPLYEQVNTEKSMKTFLKEQLENAKENNINANEINYIVIKDKKINW